MVAFKDTIKHNSGGTVYSTTNKPSAADVGALSTSGGTLTGKLTANARITALGTGNDYHTGGVELLGNGSANTVFPTLGFHQPAKFASSIQLRNGGDFRFYAQGATSYASITAHNIGATGSVNATTGYLFNGSNIIEMDSTTVRLGETNSNRTVTLDAKDGVVNVVNQTGSSYRVYHTGYKPTVDDISGVVKTSEVSTAASFAGMLNKIPRVQNNGVLEVARYVDFHTTDSTADYDIRLDCNTANNLNVIGGTLQNEGATVYTTARKPTAAEVGALATNGKAISAGTADKASKITVNTGSGTGYYPIVNVNSVADGTPYVATANTPSFRHSDGHMSITHGYLGSSGLAFNSEGYVYPRDTNHRDAGMYGSYDSYKVGHIWSVGSAYKIPANGANFGTLYGLAYKHTNNTTGGGMAGGHQMVWCENGSPKAALGSSGIWTSGKVVSRIAYEATGLATLSFGAAFFAEDKVSTVASGATAYVPLLQGSNQIASYGYRNHLMFGWKRPHNGGWGSAVLATGGSDAYPAKEYLFGVNNDGSFRIPGAYHGSGASLTGLTKTQVGLSQVNNWTASSSITLHSSATYATSAAVATLNEAHTVRLDEIDEEINDLSSYTLYPIMIVRKGDSFPAYDTVIKWPLGISWYDIQELYAQVMYTNSDPLLAEGFLHAKGLCIANTTFGSDEKSAFPSTTMHISNTDYWTSIKKRSTTEWSYSGNTGNARIGSLTIFISVKRAKQLGIL